MQAMARVDRDTWRLNESPREAREHFASRLKGWVRFRPRMFFFVFFVLKKMKTKLSPPPLRRASRLKACNKMSNDIISTDVQYI